jgi:hypothetical protein
MPSAKPDPSLLTDGPKTSQEALEDAKKKFDQLLAKQQAEPDLGKAPTPQQRAPAQKAAKASQKAQETSKAEEAQETNPEQEAPQRAPEKRGEAEKLRAKLLLAGNPKKAIESLSDEEVGEWWKKQEEREQATALALQRASELEKRLPREATSESEPLAGVPTDGLDLEEVTASLADQFGEEEAGALSKVLATVVEHLRKENSDIRTTLEEDRRVRLESIERSNRERLSEKLPTLKESDRTWKVLNAAAQAVLKADPKRQSSAAAVYDELFDNIFGDVIAAQVPAPKKDEAEERARIAAAAHTPPNSSKRQRSYSPMDAHKAAFEHLQKNPEDVDGAKRAYARFPVQ